MRVLLIEDSADVGEGIAACIQTLGHAVDWARDGLAGDGMLSQTTYDLVVLDLMLPGMDGVTLLKRLRQRRDPTAVLILTARSTIDDRVSVLDLGADDYLVKPFDFRELQARARSLLRRPVGDRSNELTCGDVSFDRVSRVASIAGEPIALTRREASLLEILLARQKMLFSKTQLLDQLFGYGAEPNENAVEVLVGRLRRRLAQSNVEIATHRGLGYRIVAR